MLSVEITVANPDEAGADELLDTLVTRIRGRLSDADAGGDPIILPDGSSLVVELLGVRWSTSASDGTSIVRGAAIAVAVSEVDEVGGDDV